jgi:hypothetical protein
MNNLLAGALLVVAHTIVVGLLSDEWRGRILGRRLADARRSRLAMPQPRISIRR